MSSTEYEATGYKCAACGAPVNRKPEGTAINYEKTCEHKSAAIVADMRATCAGSGGLKK